MNYNQSYSVPTDCGVNIYPDINPSDVFLKLLQNPSVSRYNNCVEIGEAVTWPHVSRLQTLCAVESCLEICVKNVRWLQLKEKVMGDLEGGNQLNVASGNEGGSGLRRTLSEHVLRVSPSPRSAVPRGYSPRARASWNNALNSSRVHSPARMNGTLDPRHLTPIKTFTL